MDLHNKYTPKLPAVVDNESIKHQIFIDLHEQYKNDRSIPKFDQEVKRRSLVAISSQIGRHETGRQLLGCTNDEYYDFIEKQFLPGMTWNNRGRWSIDHIKPLASFDLTDPLQRLFAFNYRNTRPIWTEENLKKNSRN